MKSMYILMSRDPKMADREAHFDRDDMLARHMLHALVY